MCECVWRLNTCVGRFCRSLGEGVEKKGKSGGTCGEQDEKFAKRSFAKCLLGLPSFVATRTLQKPVLKTFRVRPNSFFKQSKERVRCDLKRLKNRLQAAASWTCLRENTRLCLFVCACIRVRVCVYVHACVCVCERNVIGFQGTNTQTLTHPHPHTHKKTPPCAIHVVKERSGKGEGKGKFSSGILQSAPSMHVHLPYAHCCMHSCSSEPSRVARSIGKMYYFADFGSAQA